MKRIKNTTTTALMILIAVVATLTGCADKPASGKPVITVTIEPLRYFTEQIAGDKFSVVTMVPGGSSPETYEPTAQQMVDLAHSELYIKVGKLGFEHTWMSRLKANAPHLIVIDSSEGIRPLPTATGSDDPHTWTSPANAIHIAHNIYRALVMVDEKDSLYYRARLDSLCSMIKDTESEISRRLENVGSRTFIIYHPALTYFANDYGLCQIAIEEEGREPSAASLQTLIDRARKEDAQVMFMQKEFANRNTETIRQSTTVRTVEINPLSYDWHEEMMRIADALCTKQQ